MKRCNERPFARFNDPCVTDSSHRRTLIRSHNSQPDSVQPRLVETDYLVGKRVKETATIRALESHLVIFLFIGDVDILLPANRFYAASVNLFFFAGLIASSAEAGRRAHCRLFRRWLRFIALGGPVCRVANAVNGKVSFQRHSF